MLWSSKDTDGRGRGWWWWVGGVIDATERSISQPQGGQDGGETKTFSERQEVIRLIVGEGLGEDENMKDGFLAAEGMWAKRKRTSPWARRK